MITLYLLECSGLSSSTPTNRSRWGCVSFQIATVEVEGWEGAINLNNMTIDHLPFNAASFRLSSVNRISQPGNSWFPHCHVNWIDAAVSEYAKEVWQHVVSTESLMLLVLDGVGLLNQIFHLLVKSQQQVAVACFVSKQEPILTSGWIDSKIIQEIEKFLSVLTS